MRVFDRLAAMLDRLARLRHASVPGAPSVVLRSWG